MPNSGAEAAKTRAVAPAGTRSGWYVYAGAAEPNTPEAVTTSKSPGAAEAGAARASKGTASKAGTRRRMDTTYRARGDRATTRA
ncbi:hypothetical protein GCM10027199_40690 [Amycolatopsis magusensis]